MEQIKKWNIKNYQENRQVDEEVDLVD